MLKWLLNFTFKFIGSFGRQKKTPEDDALNAVLRPYIGKDLWLAVAPDRSKVICTALSFKRLQQKTNALGIHDFISFKAPKKLWEVPFH